MATNNSNISKFELQAAKDAGRTVDIKEGVSSFSYYENILSNHVSCSFSVMDSGNSIEKDGKRVSIVEGLPIRGGEEIRIEMQDGQKNKNKLKLELYLNRMKNLNQTTTSDMFTIDAVSKEFFSNEMTRVVKRYEGKISESVTKILKEVLKANFKSQNIEETSNTYNFIGNDRKPFYVCTWLGTKSIPSENYGKTAGFFFYQNQDGYNFKSVDSLLAQDPKKKLIFNQSTNLPTEYDGKILSYDFNSSVDVQSNMMLGSYKNRTLFFDPYAFKYESKIYDITQQKSVKHAGKEDDFDFVNPNFTKTETRLMTAILDNGAIPTGKDAKSQLETWKSGKSTTNDKVMERMVQSVMRYNQLFSVETSITIEGDFSLKAGDVIKCDFPVVSGKPGDIDKKISGNYLISSLCHYVTPQRCLTQLSLIRDSYGRKS